jgi:hypothetical protein
MGFKEQRLIEGRGDDAALKKGIFGGGEVSWRLFNPKP